MTPPTFTPAAGTKQTAKATLQRFPNVPIEEFAYLQPSRWDGTCSAERMPPLEQYWTDVAPLIATERLRRASALLCVGQKRHWIGLPPFFPWFHLRVQPRAVYSGGSRRR